MSIPSLSIHATLTKLPCGQWVLLCVQKRGSTRLGNHYKYHMQVSTNDDLSPGVMKVLCHLDVGKVRVCKCVCVCVCVGACAHACVLCVTKTSSFVLMRFYL